MTTRSRGPHILKGALVSVEQRQPRAILFQYNPSALRRTLHPDMVGGEEGDRSMEVRFIGAPVQTISVDIFLDAADQLEQGQGQMGIYPQLAALELLAYPKIGQVKHQESLLSRGTMEVAPMAAPRTLFVWGPRRVLPVRLTSYTISEDLFDGNLYPIQADVSLSMRVLTYSDLDSSNPGYHLFQTYQQVMNRIARSAIVGKPEKSIGVSASQL